MITGVDATRALIDAFNACQIPFMTVGSLSSNVYGIPRSTVDADFVVKFEPGDLHKLMNQLGPNYVLDSQMSWEMLTGTTRHVLHVVGSEFKLELFRLSDDEHDQTRFMRRRHVFMQDLQRETYLQTAEDAILMKLRWARGKDREDCRDMLAVQGDELDWEYLHHWTEVHGTRPLLNEIQQSLPPVGE